MELPDITIWHLKMRWRSAISFRIPVPMSSWRRTLTATCQTAGGMLYLYVDHAIYGIDMNSRENMVVADSLAEGTFAVSSDKKRIAWQEGTIYESGVLHLMDLETGENREIPGRGRGICPYTRFCRP